jgi:hypothetical protein
MAASNNGEFLFEVHKRLLAIDSRLEKLEKRLAKVVVRREQAQKGVAR